MKCVFYPQIRLNTSHYLTYPAFFQSEPVRLVPMVPLTISHVRPTVQAQLLRHTPLECPLYLDCRIGNALVAHRLGYWTPSSPQSDVRLGRACRIVPSLSSVGRQWHRTFKASTSQLLSCLQCPLEVLCSAFCCTFLMILCGSCSYFIPCLRPQSTSRQY